MTPREHERRVGRRWMGWVLRWGESERSKNGHLIMCILRSERAFITVYFLGMMYV